MTIGPGDDGELREVEAGVELAPAGWYSGDTHEHFQNCDDTLHPIEEIRARMDVEDLNVACVLVWHRPLLPFTQHVCRVTGRRDPSSDSRRILQYGVETSGLTCARWGHLIGLGIGPAEARIARGELADGDCADMPGLGLEGDGTGTLDATVAQHFFGARGAVCGYAHTIWTVGLHHPDGFDWNSELVATGFTTDARLLDPARRLAVPDVGRLMGITQPPTSARAFFPLLGAMDAVLGEVQFFETVVAAGALPVPTSPPAHWNALYYKLLSAGVRIGLSGGSDRACPIGGAGHESRVRTWALVDRFLSFGAWTRALAAGRTSVAAEGGLFLRLVLGGREVGSDLELVSGDAAATAVVELRSDRAIADGVELVVDGVVVDSRPVELAGPGETTVVFEELPIPRSSWVAARLASQRAHTAAVHAIVDGRPIGDGLTAEYWMLWCDIVAKATLDHPELPFFGAQRDEALARIAMARRAFRSLRDLAGFDPGWGVVRRGLSTAACRGPISIGTTGPVLAGQPFVLTCVNAPPLAEGLVYLSRAGDPAGTCDVDVRFFVATGPGQLIGTFPAQSTRSGYSEVTLPAPPPGAGAVHAQFVWANPPGCGGTSCGGGPAARSASDALESTVQ